MVAAIVTLVDGTPPADMAVLLRDPADSLRRGGLVAFPTETVYGLGADAMSTDAVERVFRAKGRPADNPLIVHLADVSWLDRVVADVTPLATRLASTYWPGPLTLVLRAAPDVPSVTTGGLDTVAVRVPGTALARTLIAMADTPVAAPSANLSGRPSPTSAAHVAADLADRVDWIVDGGDCGVGIESTVVDARGERPVVLREGAVTREMLGDVGSDRDAVGRSPGVRHPHYRPQARVVIAAPTTGVATANGLAARGRTGLLAPDDRGLLADVQVLGTPVGAAETAASLYAALRRADLLALDTVVVEAISEDGLGRAVMDRLRRAAGHEG